MKDTLSRAFFLVNLALLLAFASHLVRPKVVLFQPLVLASQFESIEVEAAAEHFSKHSAVFVDARERVAFLDAHVPGAVTLPYSTSPQPDTVKALAQAPLLIVYCDSKDCSAAEKTAEALGKAGLTNIKIMKEGWKGWLSRALPSSKLEEEK